MESKRLLSTLSIAKKSWLYIALFGILLSPIMSQAEVAGSRASSSSSATGSPVSLGEGTGGSSGEKEGEITDNISEDIKNVICKKAKEKKACDYLMAVVFSVFSVDLLYALISWKTQKVLHNKVLDLARADEVNIQKQIDDLQKQIDVINDLESKLTDAKKASLNTHFKYEKNIIEAQKELLNKKLIEAQSNAEAAIKGIKENDTTFRAKVIDAVLTVATGGVYKVVTGGIGIYKEYKQKIADIEKAIEGGKPEALIEEMPSAGVIIAVSQAQKDIKDHIDVLKKMYTELGITKKDGSPLTDDDVKILAEHFLGQFIKIASDLAPKKPANLTTTTSGLDVLAKGGIIRDLDKKIEVSTGEDKAALQKLKQDLEQLNYEVKLTQRDAETLFRVAVKVYGQNSGDKTFVDNFKRYAIILEHMQTPVERVRVARALVGSGRFMGSIVANVYERLGIKRGRLLNYEQVAEALGESASTSPIHSAGTSPRTSGGGEHVAGAQGTDDVLPKTELPEVHVVPRVEAMPV